MVIMSFNAICYISGANIGFRDKCYAFIIDDKKLIGVAYGYYSEYGDIHQNDIIRSFGYTKKGSGERFNDDCSINEQYVEHKIIFLHPKAFKTLKTIDLNHISLPAKVTRSKDVPVSFFSIFEKMIKLSGFFYKETKLHSYGCTPNRVDSRDYSKLIDLYSIYETISLEHTDTDQKHIYSCALSYAPIYENEVFYKLTMVFSGNENLSIARIVECKVSESKEVVYFDKCSPKINKKLSGTYNIGDGCIVFDVAIKKQIHDFVITKSLPSSWVSNFLMCNVAIYLNNNHIDDTKRAFVISDAKKENPLEYHDQLWLQIYENKLSKSAQYSLFTVGNMFCSEDKDYKKNIIEREMYSEFCDMFGIVSFYSLMQMRPINEAMLPKPIDIFLLKKEMLKDIIKKNKKHDVYVTTYSRSDYCVESIKKDIEWVQYLDCPRIL